MQEDPEGPRRAGRSAYTTVASRWHDWSAAVHSSRSKNKKKAGGPRRPKGDLGRPRDPERPQGAPALGVCRGPLGLLGPGSS